MKICPICKKREGTAFYKKKKVCKYCFKKLVHPKRETLTWLKTKEERDGKCNNKR